MRKTGQAGFTMIEMMITLTIIAVLAGIAAATFPGYSTKARVAEGLELAAGVKLAVAEYYSRTNTFPASNAAASLSAPEEITGSHVHSVSIDTMPTTGTIVVAYKAHGSLADGDTLLLVPEGRDGSVRWHCRTRTLMANLLPSSCR